MTASIALTAGFIVSRAPLVWEGTTASLNYNSRRKMVILGRIAKISAYSFLLYVYYTRHLALDQQVCDQKFRACIIKPIKSRASDSAGEACSFFTHLQVEALYRAYLLKAN